MTFDELIRKTRISFAKLAAIADHIGLNVDTDIAQDDADYLVSIARKIQGKATPEKIDAAINQPAPSVASVAAEDATVDDTVADIIQVVQGGGVALIEEQATAALAPMVDAVASTVVANLQFRLAAQVLTGLFGGNTVSPKAVTNTLDVIGQQLATQAISSGSKQRESMALPFISPAGLL